MNQCEVCGNSYDKLFQVTTSQGESHSFDSFECAIQKLAPTCSHCGCRVLGHGLEKNDALFCCAHCAKATGIKELRDRA
jgi:hypothetical protein